MNRNLGTMGAIGLIAGLLIIAVWSFLHWAFGVPVMWEGR